jgi:hypothetical protein
MKILCSLLLFCGAWLASAAVPMFNPDTNAFFVSRGILSPKGSVHFGNRIFWTDFDGGELPGKQMPPSPSGHTILGMGGGIFGTLTNGWALDRGFLKVTNRISHTFVQMFWITNGNARLDWVSATFRSRMGGNGGGNGNQVAAVGFIGTDPNNAANNLICDDDGGNFFLDEQFFGLHLTNYITVFPPPVTNTWHTISMAICSNTIVAQLDEQLIVYTETNMAAIAPAWPCLVLYGAADRDTAQDVDSWEAGYLSDEMKIILGGANQVFQGNALGNRMVQPTIAQLGGLSGNHNFWTNRAIDVEVVLPTPTVASQTVTNILPAYLIEHGRRARVWGNGTCAGTNAWFMTPDGKPILFKGQVTGPDRTNITINYGFCDLEESPWGWNVIIDNTR